MSIEKVDLVIIGAGPAGLAAAAEVAQRRANVMVLDESPIPGGRLPGQIHPERRQIRGSDMRWFNGPARAEQLVKAAEEAGAKILCGASVWGIFPDWYVGVAPTKPLTGNNTFPIGFETRAVLIATGATQHPVILPGWTLAGVITAGAAQTMINVQRVLPGNRAVFIGIDPLSLSVALLMAKAGVEVQGVFLLPANRLHSGPCSPRAALEAMSRFSDYAPTTGLSIMARASRYMSGLAGMFFPRQGINIDGVWLRLRESILAINGEHRAEVVLVARVRSNGEMKSGDATQFATDVVITSAGLSPLAELAQVAGCPLTHISDLGGWVPLHNERFETPVPGLFVAGSITGVESAPVAEIQGRVAGLAVAHYLELVSSAELENDRRVQRTAVMKARKDAVSFYPGIEAGRLKMAQIWENRFHNIR
jgi:sarcosine oxidase subunit alpha